MFAACPLEPERNGIRRRSKTFSSDRERMNNPSQEQRRPSYVKAYWRYIIPTWLFPVYFIGWGVLCERLKLPYDVVFVLFFATVGLPFFGTFLWSLRVRRHMPYWSFCFLTMVVPFLIFVAIALFLAIGQEFLVNYRMRALLQAH